MTWRCVWCGKQRTKKATSERYHARSDTFKHQCGYCAAKIDRNARSNPFAGLLPEVRNIGD